MAWPLCLHISHRTMRSSLFLQSGGLGTELSANSLLWPLVWVSDLLLLLIFILTPFVSLVQSPNIQLMPQPTLTLLCFPDHLPCPLMFSLDAEHSFCSCGVQSSLPHSPSSVAIGFFHGIFPTTHKRKSRLISLCRRGNPFLFWYFSFGT